MQGSVGALLDAITQANCGKAFYQIKTIVLAFSSNLSEKLEFAFDELSLMFKNVYIVLVDKISNFRKELLQIFESVRIALLVTGNPEVNAFWFSSYEDQSFGV